MMSLLGVARDRTQRNMKTQARTYIYIYIYIFYIYIYIYIIFVPLFVPQHNHQSRHHHCKKSARSYCLTIPEASHSVAQMSRYSSAFADDDAASYEDDAPIVAPPPKKGRWAWCGRATKDELSSWGKQLAADASHD
jgi:hypothetical protein